MPDDALSLPYCFNPRVREGRDGKSRSGHLYRGVSIHASVKDATPAHHSFTLPFRFQSTRP